MSLALLELISSGLEAKVGTRRWGWKKHVHKSLSEELLEEHAFLREAEGKG